MLAAAGVFLTLVGIPHFSELECGERSLSVLAAASLRPGALHAVDYNLVARAPSPELVVEHEASATFLWNLLRAKTGL